ncbi:hypothetical protein LXL04_005002 [Taraxacum kok-saghyz]
MVTSIRRRNQINDILSSPCYQRHREALLSFITLLFYFKIHDPLGLHLLKIPAHRTTIAPSLSTYTGPFLPLSRRPFLPLSRRPLLPHRGQLPLLAADLAGELVLLSLCRRRNRPRRSSLSS